MYSSEYLESMKIISIHTLPCHGGNDSVHHSIHF